MDRSFSLLEIKSAAEQNGERIIEGVATSFATDRMGDVVDPKGAKFALPIPLLWQHQHDKPVGHVIEAKRDGDVIRFRAKIAKVDEPGTLKDRVDEAWQSVKAGLVRAVSIGFRVLAGGAEWSKETEGVVFKAWEWLELSLVTIPANQDATIDVVRSLDLAARAKVLAPAASGTKGEPKRTHKAASGRASFKPIAKEGTAMGRYSKQIEALRQNIAERSAQADQILSAAADKGETLLEHEQEEYDAICGEIKSMEATLSRLEDAEARSARMTTESKPPVAKSGDTEERGTSFGGRVRVEVKKAAPGIHFTRITKCLGLAQHNPLHAAEIAKASYGTSGEFPIVDVLKNYGSLTRMAGTIAEHGVDYAVKAAVPMGLTTSDDYKTLVEAFVSASGEFLELLRAQTIIGRLPGYRSVPFLVPIGSQTKKGSAQWVGEGKRKPVTALGFGSTKLDLTKVAAIVAISEELAGHSSPDVELLIRDSLIEDVREKLDTDFINPGKTAVAGVSPASITNGVTPIAASGTTWHDFDADAFAAMGAMVTAGLPLEGLVWVMHPTTALALSEIKNDLGQRVYPDITPNGGTLKGYPVVVSALVPATSGGGFPIALIRYMDIAIAASPVVAVRSSREATVLLSDDPENDAATMDAVSMFQNNGIAVLAERHMNWKRLRPGSVQVITGAQYSNAPSVEGGGD